MLFFSIIFNVSANAATYYVEPVSGNDANNGTSTSLAWRSIEKALENGGMAQGDTLYLMAGTHNTFKTGTDNFISPSIATGNSSGIVTISVKPGDEGNVTVSMPSTTSTTVAYFHLNNPGINFSWNGINFLNSDGGTPVAADWFYVRNGKVTFTDVTVDNNNQNTRGIFTYKVTTGGQVEIIRSTFLNIDNYLIQYNVGGSFKMRSSVVKNSDNNILAIAGAGITGVSIEFINNTFYSVGSGSSSVFAFSVALDSLKLVNNIFYISTNSASLFNSNSTFEQWVHNNNGTNFTLTNNIIWKANVTSMGVQPGWNNIIFNSSGSYFIKLDKSNRFLDPGFVNAPSDLNISSSSHILGQGKNSELPVEGDIDGDSWVGSDIGAYAMPSSTEYQYSLNHDKVAFLGDSIFGCAGSYFGADENCVYRKFEALTGLTAVDSYLGGGTHLAAISGGRVETGLMLADYILEYHQPKVVFISLGINNVYDTDSTADNKPTNVTYQEVADAVQVIMDKLDDYGVIPIWMGILSNRDGQVEADAINNAVEIHCTVNDWICESSLDRMRSNINWQTDYYDNNGLGGLANNAHPDKDGHELMALLAEELYFIAVDTLAPTGSITINFGDTYTNTQSVTLSLSVNDTFDDVSEIQMWISNHSDFSTGSYEGFVSSKNWTLLSGDGTKSVYIKYKDTSKNVSTVYSDNIILDSTPPVGSLKINNGANSTTSPQVNLSISATDSISSVSQMIISENSNFAGANYEPFSPSKSFILSGYGNKMIYIKFKDSVGNVSTIFFDDIYYALPVQNPINTVQTQSPQQENGGIASYPVNLDQDSEPILSQEYIRLKILDSEGHPLIGAQVIIKELNIQAITDDEGIINLGYIAIKEYIVEIEYNGQQFRKILGIEDDANSIELKIDLSDNVDLSNMDVNQDYSLYGIISVIASLILGSIVFYFLVLRKKSENKLTQVR